MKLFCLSMCDIWQLCQIKKKKLKYDLSFKSAPKIFKLKKTGFAKNSFALVITSQKFQIFHVVTVDVRSGRSKKGTRLGTCAREKDKAL